MEENAEWFVESNFGVYFMKNNVHYRHPIYNVIVKYVCLYKFMPYI